MTSSGPRLAVQYFFIDILGGLLRFPLWWYTSGLFGIAHWAVGSVKNQTRNLGLTVWLKNLFVPMYGTTDIAGKLISFFLRLVIILGRSVALGVWIIIVCVVVVGYLASLPLSVLGTLYHLSWGLI